MRNVIAVALSVVSGFLAMLFVAGLDTTVSNQTPATIVSDCLVLGIFVSLTVFFAIHNISEVIAAKENKNKVGKASS